MKKFSKFKWTFELGQENFQSFNHKGKCQSHSSTSTIKCDDLGIKCQSFTIEIKSKCDDLVNQVSIYQ